MKTKSILLFGAVLCILLIIPDAALGQSNTPTVAFSSPTNGQQIVTFSGMAGTAQAVLARISHR